jgi:phosphoacetylglucosamine mutase
VDGAFGVGAPQVEKLAPYLSGSLSLEVRNRPGEGKLNEACGAEHVQKGRVPPAGFEAGADALKRCASLDGDADRLVYHYFDAAGGWHLLDGDAIAVLCAKFLTEALEELGWGVGTEEGQVNLGVVQTAYANGASTDYMRDVARIPVGIAKTGVKFVHHKALEYDVGVYFEANGHGTVLFSDPFLARLYAAHDAIESLTATQAAACRKLLQSTLLINQAIGDAISDALFVEAVLAAQNWDLSDWDALYSDLPSRQDKVKVPDRTAFVPVSDESRLVEPQAVQAKIDELAAGVARGRAFVRPSGTEDVVRIYAEAGTQAEADSLAAKVADAVEAWASS